MYTIKKKPLTPNIIWDSDRNKPMCRFKNGIVETEDKDLANRMKALGHMVDPDPEEDPESDQNADPESVAPAQESKTPKRGRKD